MPGASNSDSTACAGAAARAATITTPPNTNRICACIERLRGQSKGGVAPASIARDRIQVRGSNHQGVVRLAIMELVPFRHWVAARADDDHVALRFEDRTWTYRELVSACAQRAAFLLATRREGPLHVGVLLENVPDFTFWLGAAALAGGVV